ncbi:discoidin domain receptor, putative [Pediculus humanus corporis]|uniref:Discoidin domain receptor, putative n=1 Tax=Pediculus humanus subsp. corporis TaxID=121224 RepID=E0VXG0_PEDHC|nr:discoidin domain receptor, putative [Pediculus humanus corporis]EEB18066.1 discoidin domain receptor, putative [Pediculus humanus corporis]
MVSNSDNALTHTHARTHARKALKHIIKYEAPVAAEERNKMPEEKLKDLSYDGGYEEDGYAKKGLGQLIDGLYGEDVFEFQDETDAGSRWVGWSNESLSGRPLDITFEFDSIREFSFAHIYVNNMFTKSVQVFSSALVYFSLDGSRYQPTPVKINMASDLSRESARNVSIPLENRMGKFIKFQFFFSARWILISEISFESGSIQGNATEESLEQYFLQQDSIMETVSQTPGGETTNARKEITPAKSPTTNTQAYIGLITGVLAVIVMLLVCTILVMVRRGRKKVALLHKHTALVSSSTKPGVTINMKDLKMNMAISGPIMNNGLTRSRLTSSKTTRGHCKKTNVEKGKSDSAGNYVTGEESDSENSSVYHEPYKLLPSSGKQEYGCLIKRDALSSSKSGEYTDFTSVNSFQDEIKFSPSFFNLATNSLIRPPPYDVGNYQTPTKNNHQSFSENYYAATDIVKTETRREQNFTLGKLTPIKIPEGSAPEDSEIPEFPRHRLRVVEKLGEGGFGMVHLCEAEGIFDVNNLTTTSHKKQFVLIKSLWRGSSESTKKDFLRECNWLASLKDVNLCRIVGICSLEEPFYVIQEYTDLGDLTQFLRLENSTEENGNDDAVSYGCLIYMATQIASGMKYLESLELTHRDLSARNCLVGKHYSIKISDHAIYASKYNNDYYQVDTKARLPVRWMAWECLLLGKQSSKSDVWSFAVTLWEILMHCDEQPFAELTNEQVVENCNHLYQNNGLVRYLPRPSLCPREIYDLMCECWKRQAADRPLFSEIHLFLQRKNLGYLPETG